MVDAYSELSRSDLPERAKLLGFRDDDRERLLAAADSVITDEPLLTEVERRAKILAAGIGRIGDDERPDPWVDYEAEAPGPGADGLIPLLTLLATVDQVRGFHAGRGVPEDMSWRSLSDLGQQVWVHRLTYDRFGLHAHGWLRTAWSGELYWLGRLQFNLIQDDAGDGWMLSTHIPRTGPLTPDSVDAAFAEATRFFGRYFPDYPATAFFCRSWLLDPELANQLAHDSNMARFQRRWRLRDDGREADGDALFFTFARRGDVDLDTLPQETTLQRLIVERLRAGKHWQLVSGTVPIEPDPRRVETYQSAATDAETAP